MVEHLGLLSDGAAVDTTIVLISTIVLTGAILRRTKIVDRIRRCIDTQNFLDNFDGFLTAEKPPIDVVDLEVLNFSGRELCTGQELGTVLLVRRVKVVHHVGLQGFNINFQFTTRFFERFSDLKLTFFCDVDLAGNLIFGRKLGFKLTWGAFFEICDHLGSLKLQKATASN